MNLHTIGIIIRREYLNKVKKKSFLITTFIVPVLMAALCVVPILLLTNVKDKTKHIAVVDRSLIAMEFMTDSKVLSFKDYTSWGADSVKANMASEGLDAVLCISELNVEKKTITAELISVKPVGMEISESIERRVNDAIEEYRIQSYNIDGLRQIMDEVSENIHLYTYTLDQSGKEKISESGVYSIISMVLGIIIFLFITLFGGMVMTAVIEEKSSRVVEVLISSVKATELMFGKIIGVALVAITQFVLWIALTGVLVTVATGFIGKDKILAMAGDAQTMAPTEMVESMPIPSEVGVVLSTLSNIPVAEWIAVFLVFFILGYMLYASLYAAIGSAVENEGDSQQLQMPVTIPLMLAYFIALYTFNAPDSSIAWWGSMIPFTSPIVMLARLPFGVPAWEIIVSVCLLAVTFVICAWFSAKIYKVGILMFGKKTTFKDLLKWLKQK